MRKKYKFYQNPIKWYTNVIKNSIEPTNPSHKIMMNVEIDKGQTEGRALIPCAIYTMDHSIDTNPSLIRKKDRKLIKKLSVNKKIEFDSNKYDVELTDEEKRLGYQLKELERCEHCKQKIVIAELAETRYRSCPDVKVKVSDPAKEDLVIPVQFGIRKGQVLLGMVTPFVFDLLIVYMAITILHPTWNFFTSNIITEIAQKFKPIAYLSLALIGGMIVHIMAVSHYKGYKLFKWYNKTKSSLEKVKNYKHRG